MIIERSIQEVIYEALKNDGHLSSCQVFGFLLDAKLVNDGHTIMFDSYIDRASKQKAFYYHETFMIKWEDFESFYLLNSDEVVHY